MTPHSRRADFLEEEDRDPSSRAAATSSSRVDASLQENKRFGCETVNRPVRPAHPPGARHRMLDANTRVCASVRLTRRGKSRSGP